MMYAPEIEPGLKDQVDDDPVFHAVCICNTEYEEQIALCGQKLRPEGPRIMSPRLEDRCVVCVDLFPLPCARCGRC